ncbi:hypothetical protein [Streptomyces huasconensis]|uniref:hypothetical protein n=1 Tax=Streptomyces huasconensis TaxID=1854574 RepID=UPI0033CD5E2A
MKHFAPARISNVCGGAALGIAFWIFLDVNPSVWQFTASAVAAFVVLESISALVRLVDRRTAQK